jgi:hypothetical protein
MDQMLVWTFIHREVLRAQADRKPVDIIDIYEDNSSSLGLFRRVGRLLEWARSRQVSTRPATGGVGRKKAGNGRANVICGHEDSTASLAGVVRP